MTMRETSSAKNQCLAAFAVNLIAIGYGASCAWTSPSLPLLLSDATPLPSGPITQEEASWIGSILCIGALIGTFTFGWMADKFGRKISSSILAFPQIFSWVLIIFATNVQYLIAARFLAGFSGGGAFVLIPLYIAEIAEDRVRGSLSSMMVLSSNFGFIIVFFGNSYLSYAMLPWALISIPVIFFLVFFMFPETPPYLMKMNKHEEAERSLRFFRGYRGVTLASEDFRDELVKLKSANFVDEEDDDNYDWTDFTTKSAKKALFIAFVLVATNEFCGIFAMVSYSNSIFEEAGSNLSPNASSIIVGINQIFAAYLSTVLVDRAGRKILLTISCLGLVLGLGTLSAFSYIKILGYDVSAFNWVPLVSFSFAIFIANIGIMPLPFVVFADILPVKIKGPATTLCMTVLWIFQFTALKMLSTLIVIFGMHGTCLIFASVCFIGSIFIMRILPETKGKSFEEIQRILEK